MVIDKMARWQDGQAELWEIPIIYYKKKRGEENFVVVSVLNHERD